MPLSLKQKWRASVFAEATVYAQEEVDLTELPASFATDTFAKFEGQWLQCSPRPQKRGVNPYSRALNYHAKRAHLNAVKVGWITQEQCDSLQSFSSDYEGKERAERCLAWVHQQLSEA